MSYDDAFWSKVSARVRYFKSLPKGERKKINELASKGYKTILSDPEILGALPNPTTPTEGLSIPVHPVLEKKIISNSEKGKRKTLMARQGGKCAYCETPFSLEVKATLDHIKPKSKGGSNRIDNLVLACRNCNGLKGNLSSHKEAVARANIYLAFADMLKEKGYLE